MKQDPKALALRIFAFFGAVRLTIWLVQDLMVASDTLTNVGLAWRLLAYVIAPLLIARSLQADPPRVTPWSVARYFVFAVAPALLLFHLHQSIAFGGFFGELRVHGIHRYLATFAEFYVATLLHVTLAVTLADMLTSQLKGRARIVRDVVYLIAIPSVVASQINY